jgi:hypothetical protein
MRSRSSRRRVPTTLSQIAFALGACGGLRRISGRGGVERQRECAVVDVVRHLAAQVPLQLDENEIQGALQGRLVEELRDRRRGRLQFVPPTVAIAVAAPDDDRRVGGMGQRQAAGRRRGLHALTGDKDLDLLGLNDPDRAQPVEQGAHGVFATAQERTGLELHHQGHD